MAATDTAIKDIKVLLVEDSLEAMNLIRQMLQDMGITQVYTARDGLEALNFLSAIDGDDLVDLILCDWNMPRMSGLDLLKQLRTADPDLPFMMITGAADMQSVTEAKSYGVTGYIKKPFSADELQKKLHVMARVIAHRR